MKEAVEGAHNDIRQRGDAAVRELAEHFNNWSPETFQLTEDEIQSRIINLYEQTVKDIKFVQAQVRRFALGVFIAQDLKFYVKPALVRHVDIHWYSL